MTVPSLRTLQTKVL